MSIKSPQELNGKRVGIHGPNTLTELLVNSTISKYNIKPNVLVVPGSEARAQALLNNQLDAAPAEIKDAITIQTSKPGQYHILVPYAKELPFLGSHMVTTKELIDKDPDLVQGAVSTWAEVMTRIPKEPGLLKTAAAKELPKLGAEEVDLFTKEYLAIVFWNPNLTADMAEKTIKFMQDTGSLKDAGPSLDSVVDLRFIQRALQ